MTADLYHFPDFGKMVSSQQPKQDSGDAVNGDSNGTTVAEQSNHR